MAPLGSFPPAGEYFPAWERDYEAVLSETDIKALFKRVEIAEAAILTRCAALKSSSEQHCEWQALEQALTKLGVIKRERLKFL